MIRGGVLLILGQLVQKKSNPKEPLLLSITQDYPWRIVATDLLTLDGKDHLVVVDYYSRFFEVVELTCTLSKVVIHKLKSNIRSLRNPWKGRFRQWPPVLLSRICNLCKRVQLHTLHPAPTTHNSMDWPTNVCKQLKRYLKSQTWQPGPLLGFTSLPCNSPRHRLFPCWATIWSYHSHTVTYLAHPDSTEEDRSLQGQIQVCPRSQNAEILLWPRFTQSATTCRRRICEISACCQNLEACHSHWQGRWDVKVILHKVKRRWHIPPRPPLH